MELLQNGRVKTTQKVLPTIAVFRQVAPGVTLSSTERSLPSLLAKELPGETIPPQLKVKSGSSKMTKLKKRFKKKLFRTSSKEKEGLSSSPTTHPPLLAWQSSTSSVNSEPAMSLSSFTAATEEEEEEESEKRRRHSQEVMCSKQKAKPARQLRRVHTFSAKSSTRTKSRVSWSASGDTDV